MKSMVRSLFCGLLIMGVCAGCNPPKPTDDGSGPRGRAKGQMSQNPKAPDKPLMEGNKLPPKPPPIPKRDQQ